VTAVGQRWMTSTTTAAAAVFDLTTWADSVTPTSATWATMTAAEDDLPPTVTAALRRDDVSDRQRPSSTEAGRIGDCVTTDFRSMLNYCWTGNGSGRFDARSSPSTTVCRRQLSASTTRSTSGTAGPETEAVSTRCRRRRRLRCRQRSSRLTTSGLCCCSCFRY